MIAVAVVASLVVYAWVMGYVGFQTNKTGESVQIQSVAFSGTPGNFRKSRYSISAKCRQYYAHYCPQPMSYVNGLLDTTATFSPATNSLASGNTGTITASATQPVFTSGTMVTVKVTTSGGTYSQITIQVP